MNIVLKVKVFRRVFLKHFKSDFKAWTKFGTLYAKSGPQATIWKLFKKKSNFILEKDVYLICVRDSCKILQK